MEFCATRKTPEAIAVKRQLLTFGGVEAVYKARSFAQKNSILNTACGVETPSGE
jgi:hypothetical protein